MPVRKGKQKHNIIPKTRLHEIAHVSERYTLKGVIWCWGVPPRHTSCLQMTKLWFFASASFDNVAISEDSSPAICSHYEANYGWMSRQFPDNCQCSRERQYSLTLLASSSFSYWWLCTRTLKYSSILGAGAHYTLPQLWRDSIPPSFCCTCHQQRLAHPQWTVSFFSVYQSRVSISVSFNTFHR